MLGVSFHFTAAIIPYHSKKPVGPCRPSRAKVKRDYNLGVRPAQEQRMRRPVPGRRQTDWTLGNTVMGSRSRVVANQDRDWSEYYTMLGFSQILPPVPTSKLFFNRYFFVALPRRIPFFFLLTKYARPLVGLYRSLSGVLPFPH